MQFSATNTGMPISLLSFDKKAVNCPNDRFMPLFAFTKNIKAFIRKAVLPLGFLMAFLVIGATAIAQTCPSSIQGNVLNSSNPDVCSGQTSSINISVTPPGGGTYSGSFVNGRTFTGLTPVSGFINPTYTFTNGGTSNVMVNFTLQTLVFTPTNGSPCTVPTTLTGSTNISVQPVADISAVLNTPVNTCSSNTVSISITNPNGVGGTYDRTATYNGAGHSASTTATGQTYPGNFTDVLTNNSNTPITVVYTFMPRSPGSLQCTGTPVTVSVTVYRNNRIYVNDSSAMVDTYTFAFGNNATGNGTRCAPYRNIQYAIDNAVAGDTIYVDGGSYSEEFVVNKSLTILGSNAGKDPLCTGAGHTNAAATLFATGNNNDLNSPSLTKIISITANNVVIDGFTLDGDNAQAGTYNAAVGIEAKSGKAGLDIKNNIVQHFAGAGIYLANDVNGGAMSSNNQVHNNKLTDMNAAALGFGIGVYTGNNTYADIKDNCMTSVRKGIQGGENNYIANTGNVSPVWSGNTIESYRIGIWNNLAYGTASPVTITGNTVTTMVGSTSNRGIEISSLQTTAGVTVSGNTIGSAAKSTQNGIYLWNNPTSTTVTIGANMLTNCEYGIFATNKDSSFGDALSSSYIVNGTTITGGKYGIYVQDSSTNANNATVAVQVTGNTQLTNNTNGLVIVGASSSATFGVTTPATFTGQAKYITLMGNGTDAPATGITATAVSFDGQTGASASPAQNFAIEDKIDHKIDSLPLGFVLVKTANAFVTDIAPLAPTSNNNDYTRVRNGILAASTGFTINHSGTFNWAEMNAAAAWALGNDGLTGTTATSNDDYSILVPANLNGITFTAPDGLNTATIQGPGDLPNANLEGVLVFDGGDNQNWTISNMRFYDFDLSVGMFSGAGGIDAFNNTTITNNAFRIPKDLNATTAPADVNQNIGIHYSFGTNQTISNNTFEVDGTGVSNGSNYSTSNVMQSNTDGGTAYDGLKITGNTITVTGVPATAPNQSVIRGIWENGHNQGAAIEISANKFTNSAAGNTANLNRQTAFWVTSNSNAGKKVTYKNNEVTGYRDGIAWLGGMFTGNSAPDYNTGATPVEIMNNKLDSVLYGVVVRKSVASSNPGSPAIIHYNSFTHIASDSFAISNEGTGTTDATCNWYGTVGAGAIAALINGPVTYSPYLLDGTDNDLATRGFQTTAACGTANSLYVNDTYVPADDHYTTATGNDNNPGTPSMPYATITQAVNSAGPGDTIYVDAGNFTEDYVFIYQKQTIRGSNYGIDPNTGIRLAESIVTPTVSDTINGVLVYVAPEAAGSRFDGFTLDGNNTAYGIYAYADTVTKIISNDTISNNIVKNMYANGVLLYANSNGQAGSGNVVSNNKFSNILQSVGTAILLYNNAYTTVANNVMDSVRIGVQTGNFYRADPGNSHAISNNTIRSQAIGIWTNLHYANSAKFNVTNNTLTNYPSATPVQSIGLRVQSIQNNVGVNISSNNVTGNKYGVALTNCPTTDTITISGGTLSGNAVGVFATNTLNTPFNANATSSAYIINGVNIQNASYAGIEIADTSATTNGSTVAVSVRGNTTINNSTTGLLLQGGNASASFSGATPASFTGQSLYINQISNGTTVPATGINAIAVTFNGVTGATASTTQNFDIEDKINHKIDLLPLGFVTVKAANAFVTDIAPLAPTATNNDYTRVRNGILAASSGFTINHDGTFNWAEANADTAWAKGNDGIRGTTDDYSILVPNNLNRITFTAPGGLGTATIQGPGDLPNANLEGVLVFDGTVNQGWNINKMQFSNFDLSIGMFNGAGGVNAFDSTIITNNTFTIANDLNPNAAPADVNQNIGINYSFGTNQTISNNTFNIPGDGVSFDANNLSSMVAMQSNTSGGTVYDGLKIQNNTINITSAQSTNPSRILGIWENGHNQDAAINISGNIFTNVAGNTPSLNIQRAFRVTSKSGANKSIVYQNNEVTGANIAFEWITGYTYPSGAAPVQLLNNKIDTTYDAVVVRTDGASALVNNNSFTRSVRYAISNEAGTDTIAATCNWYGTANANLIAPKINGSVTYIPYLLNGTDGSPATGFQPTAACNGSPVVITNTTITPRTCSGNGSFTVTFNGGSSPYSLTYTGQSSGGPTTVPNPATISNLDSGTYTITITDANGSFATTTATITYNPVTNTRTGISYTTIQGAINAGTTINTDTLQVCAGRYVEEILVNKSLTILGNNAGTAGCVVRNAESILYPARVDFNYTTYNTTNHYSIMRITADNVTIKGFTFNGDNPDSTNGVLTNGATIETSEGITIETRQQNITVQNNIFKNIAQTGVSVFQPYNSLGTSGNTITNNKFSNIDNSLSGGYGIGVLIYNNFYAQVDNNCMDTVGIGVQTGNYHLVNPGTPAPSISNNAVKARIIGVWHNLTYASASNFTINNNTLGSSINAGTNTGLFLSSIQQTVGATVSGNIISGTKYGVELWNNPTTDTVTISGGSITNCDTAIFANNYDSYADPMNLAANSGAMVSGVNISGGNIGIHVKDNNANTNNATVAVRIRNNTSITNNGTGIKVTGANASISFPGATPATLSLSQTKYIDLASNGADVPATDVDATSVIFGGQTGATASLAQNFAIEDKINHKIDSLPLGFVLVKTANTFVTPNSYLVTNTNGKVSRGVAAATAGFTENVQAGLYADTVTVNKQLTILGPNSSINPNTGSRVAEAVVVPATNNVASGRIFNIAANGVTISGFIVDGDNTTITGGTAMNGADINASAGIATGVYPGTNGNSNTLIENNIVKNFDNTASSTGGIYGNGSQSSAITGNIIRNNQVDNTKYWGILTETNWYADIQGNTITRSNRGIQADGYFVAAPNTTTVSGNNIRYYKRGITVNNNFGNASQFAVSGNTVTPETNGMNEDGGSGAISTNKGIVIWSMASGTSGITVSGNKVTGAAIGEELWNNASGKVSATADTILNSGTTGVLIPTNSTYGSAGYGSYATITQDSINSASGADGILVTDNDGASGTAAQVNLTNTYVVGGTNSIRFTGPEIAATTAINNNSLTGASAKAIDASAYTGAAAINATCNWYGSNVSTTVATRISGLATYIPYLSSGIDGAQATPGFQPMTPCTNCTTITATITPTDNLCNGGSDGKVTVTKSSITGGVGPYTFKIAGPTVNTTGDTSGVYTGLIAGSYTVTVYGANGCSTQQAPVTVGQPTGTAPDANLNVAAASSYFFPTPMTENTYVYQIFESAGNPITSNPSMPTTLRITKQNGYTYTFNIAATSTTVGSTTYPVDNIHWTPDDSNSSLYFIKLNPGSQINCQSVINLEVKITRNTMNKANFSVSSLIFQVPGETNFSTNSTNFQAVGN